MVLVDLKDLDTFFRILIPAFGDFIGGSFGDESLEGEKQVDYPIPVGNARRVPDIFNCFALPSPGIREAGRYGLRPA